MQMTKMLLKIDAAADNAWSNCADNDADVKCWLSI